MSEVSSRDLHPASGGRFVFVRREGAGAVYDVEVFLPAGQKESAVLSWTDAGQASLSPPLSDAWAHGETLKLARVLRKNPKGRLSRWRG